MVKTLYYSFQCIQNATDTIRTLVTFQILLVYPLRQIQQRFEALSTLSIQIKDILHILRFCSINIHSASVVSNMNDIRSYVS
jgi:hypothetical protein